MVLQIGLILILQELELIQLILYLLKKYWLFIMWIILIKSVVYKNKNYYHNISLEKGSYKESNTEYF